MYFVLTITILDYKRWKSSVLTLTSPFSEIKLSDVESTPDSSYRDLKTNVWK